MHFISSNLYTHIYTYKLIAYSFYILFNISDLNQCKKEGYLVLDVENNFQPGRMENISSLK